MICSKFFGSCCSSLVFFHRTKLREIKCGDGWLMFSGDGQLRNLYFSKKTTWLLFFNYRRQISLVYVNCSMCELQDCFFCNIFRFVVRWEEIAVGFIIERNLTDGRIAIWLELMKILCSKCFKLLEEKKRTNTLLCLWCWVI